LKISFIKDNKDSNKFVGLHAEILFQKRKSEKDSWPEKMVDLRNVPNDFGLKIQLDTAQTYELSQALQDAYPIGEDNIASGRRTVIRGVGKDEIIVRTKSSEAAEAMIDDDGNIIPISDLTIRYVKETGKRDDTGAPYKHEVEFMERIDGMLYLTAELETVREMSNLQGVFFHEIPFNGNPSDLKSLKRCVPSVSELVLRKC
jgi:hypothetical protein